MLGHNGFLTKESLLSEYRSYREKAKVACSRNRIEKSLNFALYSAYIAWSFPILYNFIDDDLEFILEENAKKIINNAKAPECDTLNNKRVVLYAGQLIDNGALTEQYLHYFIEHNYKVLVIVPSLRNIVNGKSTITLIENSAYVDVYIPKSARLEDKILDIYNKVIEFSPSNIFLHFLPNDVVGYCTFSRISYVPRFYIVHNDHTFWLGKGCADYFLEFRKFGFLLSQQRRGIPQEKLLMLPFYPINNKVDFQGFPFLKSDQVIGISGANLYKYFMDPELKYFYAIRELLERNPKFFFCLCGYGDGIKEIVEIFDVKEIKSRFHFLGRRDDFYSLVGQADILFESYPLKGGLTQLFAIEQDIPLVGISNKRSVSGSIQDCFELDGYKEPENMDEFIDEADQLIKSKELREQKARLFKGQKFNKADFDKQLSSILNGSHNIPILFKDELLSLDDEYYLQEYLMLPNSAGLFIKSKLYFLKGLLRLEERLSYYLRLFQDRQYPLAIKEKSRLALLVLFGK